ncbi:Endonuclease/exonuclease/phosphatase, partial [Roridomyces roridus]
RISRNTRAEFTFGGLNINGRRKKSIRHPEHKWHDLNRLLFDEKLGIPVISETHMSAEQVDEIRESHLNRRMEIYHTSCPDNPSTKGVAIIINKELLSVQDIEEMCLIPGRALMLKIPWHMKRVITVLGVYAPADSGEENAKFWDELTEMWLQKPNIAVPDIVGGDFNLTPEMIDRLPHRCDHPRALEALARFKTVLGLGDGFTATYPDEKAYTYTSTRQPPTFARLDYILVSPELQKTCRDWKISDAAGNLSDHKLTTVRIRAPGSPYIGKGCYAIPEFVVQDDRYIADVIRVGSALEAHIRPDGSAEETLQLEYNSFKEYMRDEGRRHAKESKGATHQKKCKLAAERDQLLSEHDPPGSETVGTDGIPGPDHETVIRDKLASVEKKISELVSLERDRARTATRVGFHGQTERLTKFSVNLHKDKTPRDTLDMLRMTDTVPEQSCRRSDEMASLAKGYYEDLQ